MSFKIYLKMVINASHIKKWISLESCLKWIMVLISFESSWKLLLLLCLPLGFYGLSFKVSIPKHINWSCCIMVKILCNYPAYHVKSTNPPFLAISAFTRLAKSTEFSPSLRSIGGKYHTSQTMAQEVIIM
jgi:hypothetical protein